MQLTPPSNAVNATGTQRNNIFYPGQAVSFNLAPATNGTSLSATNYEVRDYYGTLVANGAVSSSSLSVNVSQPGWYKLYLYSSSSSATYGDSVGGTAFSIFRNNANLPAMPAPSVSPEVDSSIDPNSEVVRDVANLGPQRYAVIDATQGTSGIGVGSGGSIAAGSIAADIAVDEQLYLNNGTGPDASRPRSELIAFPNGTSNLSDSSQNASYLAGITQIVSYLHTKYPGSVFYYEARNEPDLANESAAQFIAEIKAFYNTVKAADPTAKVLGPGTSNITSGLGLSYIQQFLAGGGAQYVDGFSFHAYNTSMATSMPAPPTLRI